MTEFSAVDLSEEKGMQWQAVDSSQIEAIGYESGAEYPLGIKFHANKKQKENMKNGKPFPLPGSEYHYANVTPELYAQLLAAKDNPVYNNSIGTFFGKIIKAYADLYPFVKVEAERPTEPAAANVTRETSGTLKKKENPQPSLDLDGDAANGTISPSTSLSIIDTMADDLLFTPGAVTDAQLAAGRDWYLTEAKKYDISTEKARTELKRFARPLQKLRTGIEARAKELTGATKRKIAAIDAEKRRLVQLVGEIEKDVLEPLTAWEQEEEERKVRLSGIVKSLGEHVVNAIYPSIASLEETIAELESFDSSTMQEYKVGAESAIAASLRVLKPELARRQEAERNAAELAKLRREQAEREEDEAKRQEDARVAAAVESAKVAIRQEVIAELTVPVEPQTIPGKWQDSGTSAVDPEDGDNETPETTQSGIVETHEQVFNAQAVAAFIFHCGYTRQQAIAGLTAITKGLITHISITY